MIGSTMGRAIVINFALTCVVAATPTLAQVAEDRALVGDGRDDVVVTGLQVKKVATATKTDTPLIDTPQSVTVIDRDELTRRNVLSISQAVTYVAGVSPAQRGAMTTRYDLLTVRGYQPAFFLDGMRLLAGPYSLPQIDFNRIDHLDILKGPASVLYGNSTPGGLINVASKTPQPVASGLVEVQAGNFAHKRALVDVNQPLDADGKWQARLVGGWQKFDSITRLTTNERWHVSPTLTFAPDAATSLTLIAAYQHSPSAGGYAGVPAYGSALPSPLGELPRDINTGDPGYERYDQRHRSISALFRHDFGKALTYRASLRYMRNTLSYRQMFINGYQTTGTGTARQTNYAVVNRSGGGADESFGTLTLDNSLGAKIATGPLKHELLVGIDYQSITGTAVQQFNAGVTTNPLTSFPPLNLYAPTYGVGLPSLDLTVLSSAYSNTYSKRHQVGAYAQDQIAIGGLHLIASGRQDWYDQTSVNRRTDAATPLSQSAFTMRLGALYEFGVGLAPYYSYSESFEPQAGTTYLGVSFVPTTGQQHEVGVKYQPRGTELLVTLSGYELKRRNVPVGDPLAGTGGIPSTSQVQIGEVRVRGLELEGRGDLRPGLSLILSGSYTDAIVTQGTPAAGITPTTTGTRQLGVPEWAASGFLTWDLAKGSVAGALGGLNASLGARFLGGSDGTTTYAVVNGASLFQRFRTGDFTLLDAVLGYDLGRLSPSLRRFSLTANVTNLLDRKYVQACPLNNSCYWGDARRVIGSLRYRW